MNKRLQSWATAALLAGTLAAPLTAAEPASPPAAPDSEWRLHGNDVGEQRHSTLRQINSDNVDKLGLAWSFDMYTRRGVEATPLMVDGTLYVSGSWSMVYALDARTGALKWFYNPEVDRAFLAKGCCDAVNRGVAYADGRVYVGTYDGRLVALDAGDGSVLWDVQTTDREKSYTITGAPRIAGDLVVIGNGGAELGVRGYVTAYELETGKQAWRFYTVPGNPADGFESPALEKVADTWTGEWWQWGGGGTVWDAMVYDPELGLLYIGVGNGSPWNHKLRSPGGGDNLFLTSIVAVKAATGDYVWHYQTTPGETWDYTATQHMILADLELDGKPRKVLMQAPKNGFFYVLDRVSGELLAADPYAITTWASHVDLETGRPVETPDARLFDGENVSLPSNAGAHNWHPMSYHPGTGLVYIPAMQIPIKYLEPSNERDRKPGQGYWNVGFDRIANVPPNLPNLNEVLDETYKGRLLAWDPLKGELRWASDWGRVGGGGVLSTAGNLVFQGSGEAQLLAYDATSGEVLWSHDTQTLAMAAPITYAIDGEQYLAVAVGFGGGAAAEAGPILHHRQIPNLSRVLVYKLGGKATLPPVPERDRELPKPAPVTASVETLEHGKVIYQRHCSYCHGDGMRTGGLTPDLRYSGPAVHEQWQEIVREGLLAARGMISFAPYVDQASAEAIRQYVLLEANRLYQRQQEARDNTP
ncbi:PQQ-dependent dehydrogenase, methanol/ethanol family [Seongchinamella unica]|uniref:PQQ-dependent dehydrogenase, methanol/ethanol family n=1 Tax=Seongchinamella unica TaxID=2547392 RepID=A0A4R5LQG7_9GAMM|nr:PQQ-dependent dehydrogenase, methanol/ethanol family [Seongchinamella unica]TDG12834.1 PQQ-dependent dehydrogenase, methanol/ethanol family [Seongchinamella unica]